ncbi:porin [Niveibacterium sp. 24ML]|uniref:DcaP family trimeric outer membrane transporter n=1 Tax=Niveibacterium sp. 24ML TaxID=2985512 RepID=UPI0022705DDD|nr:DcaP family trimeric outer membrane transporter [Niveibacterium sp. 24ML]MCX9155951.1 porin [Niveibacterium sp. 24ML]
MTMRLRVMAAAVAAAFCLPVYAATDAKVIERLERQIQELQREVQALKAAQQKSDATAAAASAAAAEAKAASATASPAAIKDLQDQIEAQGKEAVVKGDIPGSYRRAGEETSVRVYGVAELNLVHDFGADNGANDYSTFAPYMPLDGQSNREGMTYMHARTSRIGIEASTPSSYGPINVKIEGDFNNDPRTGNAAVTGSLETIYTQQSTNSYGFRLRHAYGQVGGFLVGQTWSSFMDVDALPETVDFNGPIGATFIRQPMVRYTYTTPDIGNFTAAIESSVSYVLDETGVATSAGFTRWPDLVLRYDKGFDWGTLSLRAVTHELRVKGGWCLNGDTNADGSCVTAVDADTSKRGYGLAASSFIKTSGDDFLTIALTGGSGIGRYFNYIEGAIYDPGAQQIYAEKALGVVLGYQIKPSDKIRYNLAYGYQRNFDNDYTDFVKQQGLGSGQYGINRMVQQAHGGLFWSPFPKLVDIGAEVIWATRETLDGENGQDTRLNFSGKYYFQ